MMTKITQGLVISVNVQE